MSIHKSQGSEFPTCHPYYHTSASRAYAGAKSHLYSHYTRQKQSFILLGELQAFDYATQHIGTARKPI